MKQSKKQNKQKPPTKTQNKQTTKKGKKWKLLEIMEIFGNAVFERPSFIVPMYIFCLKITLVT